MRAPLDPFDDEPQLPLHPTRETRIAPRQRPSRSRLETRVRKTATQYDGTNNGAVTDEWHTLYIFPSLEVRRARYGTAYSDSGTTEDFEVTKDTEVPYLFANGVRLGRVVYQEGLDVGVGDTGTQRVFLMLGDFLGSTSIVIDKATSEVVERSTYQAYGGGRVTTGRSGGRVFGRIIGSPAGRGRRGRADLFWEAVPECVVGEVGECGSIGDRCAV